MKIEIELPEIDGFEYTGEYRSPKEGEYYVNCDLRPTLAQGPRYAHFLILKPIDKWIPANLEKELAELKESNLTLREELSDLRHVKKQLDALSINHFDLKKKVKRDKKSLEELKKVNRWRSVEDELPNRKDHDCIKFFEVIKDGEPYIAFWDYLAKQWDSPELGWLSDITHWRPLPELPAVEGGSNE